jgi:hypothetical protein
MTRVITLSIAGFVLQLRVADAALARLIGARYGGYRFDHTHPALALDLHVDKKGIPGPQRLRLDGTGGERIVHRRDINAVWADGAGEARVGPSVYSVDALLRVVLATELPARGRVLLHASAVSHNRRGWVFCGVSGSGKTTSTRLAAPARVLNDEIVAVGLDKTRIPRVWATPFWGELGTGPASPRPVRLAALLSLHKDRLFDAIRLEPQRSMGPLLRCVCLFGRDRVLMQQSIDALAVLVHAVPVFEFHFVKQTFDWQWMERITDGSRTS